MKRVVVIAVCLLALSASFLIAPVQAQTESDGLHLTTSPLPISLTAKPGTTASTDLRVRNSGTGTEVLKVGLMKFSAKGDDGLPELEERGPRDDYFDWVTFSKDQFVAEPNEWQTISMDIKIPSDAALGYYYAVTFSRANPTVTTNPAESKVEGGTAVLILLNVDSPNAKRELKLSDFRIEKRSYEFLPVQFSIRLQNSGNIHTSPSGTVFIKKGNTQVAAISLNSSNGNILPDSSRNFTVEWNDGFPVYVKKEAGGAVVLKDGQPTYNLTWDTSKFNRLRWGKYTAQLVAVYDNGKADVPLESVVSFWVIPWRLIAIGIAVPVIPSVAVYLLMRWRFKRKMRKGPRA